MTYIGIGVYSVALRAARWLPAGGPHAGAAADSKAAAAVRCSCPLHREQPPRQEPGCCEGVMWVPDLHRHRHGAIPWRSKLPAGWLRGGAAAAATGAVVAAPCPQPARAVRRQRVPGRCHTDNDGLPCQQSDDVDMLRELLAANA